jgi:hypothetical protein
MSREVYSSVEYTIFNQSSFSNSYMLLPQELFVFNLFYKSHWFN